MRLPLALFLSLAVAGCAASNLPPAAPAAEPMPGANRIVVHLDVPPAEAYGYVVRTWAGLGYGLSASSEAARVATTEYRGVGGNRRVALTAAVAESGSGSDVTVRGQALGGVGASEVLLGRSRRNPAPTAVANGQGVGSNAAFAAMESAARALGGSLMYARD